MDKPDDNVFQKAIDNINSIIDAFSESEVGIYNHIDTSHENYLLAFDIAKTEYENIRNDPEDIEKISQHSQKELCVIERIKNHIFYSKHDIIYQDGTRLYKRLDEDPEIVNSWVRLRENKHVKSDYDFLNHEERESELVTLEKMNYNDAHNKTISEGLIWNPEGE
ncbi:hypothetical protein ACI8BE_010305 [Proteus mirabilis]|nr:hypothetical protein [Proteus mirabilis]HEK1094671.1 hypothetical protein [Proteus mirabilis]